MAPRGLLSPRTLCTPAPCTLTWRWCLGCKNPVYPSVARFVSTPRKAGTLTWSWRGVGRRGVSCWLVSEGLWQSPWRWEGLVVGSKKPSFSKNPLYPSVCTLTWSWYLLLQSPRTLTHSGRVMQGQSSLLQKAPKFQLSFEETFKCQDTGTQNRQTDQDIRWTL